MIQEKASEKSNRTSVNLESQKYWLYYVGQVQTGTGFAVGTSIACEFLVDLMDQNTIEYPPMESRLITQASEKGPQGHYSWGFPLNMKIASSNSAKPPILICKAWAIDGTSATLAGYGSIALPKRVGTQTLNLQMWMPIGNWQYSQEAFYLGHYPRFENIASFREQERSGHKGLVGTGVGSIKIELTCMKELNTE